MHFRGSLAAFFAIAMLMSPARAQDSPEAKPSPSDEKSAEDPKDAGSVDPDRPKGQLEAATFGGGCFWCSEAVFELLPGVKSVISGYAGGRVPNPTYEMVSSGLTGHAEVVQVVFDPETISFEQLLKVFYSSHDPTTRNRQGPDFGTQYRSIILYQNDEQRRAARAVIEAYNARSPRLPIVTDVAPLTRFYPAEPYHQDYYRQHPGAPYSTTYIAPKVEKLKHMLK